MANQDDESDKTASAARRPDVGTTPARKRTETGAGQEARRGVPPGDHTHEHQSQYGGGGPNGGVTGPDHGEGDAGAGAGAGDDDRA